MQILVDKITSVTKNIPLTHRVTISEKIPSKDGVIVVVEVLDDKKLYNQLELRNGRFSTAKKGDIIIVALGQRRALKGFVGDIPKEIHIGDKIHLLNMGGVAGVCTSTNSHAVGRPMRLKVLGAACDKKGKILTIKDYTLFHPAQKIIITVPLIMVSGTSMNVGKTSVASEIIKHASHKGYRFAAAKVAGIAALKDTEAMEDYGACAITSFLDAGYSSTIGLNGDVTALTYGALHYLTQENNPDAIVIECGDGILGEYGVKTILKDTALRKHIKAHIGCAYDPVGALKLSEICTKMNVPLSCISGPVTDNSVGVEFIERYIGIPGINALYNGKELFDSIESLCFRKK